MKNLFFTALIVFIISTAAFGQVDTLALSQIADISLPNTISNLYTQDLNGDSLKEIILTTANEIYVYNPSGDNLIWSSPTLSNPRDLQFADLNADGLVDIAVRDSSYLHLYDPHHSTTMWTSPLLDSTFACYAVGQRNDDQYYDVGIIRRMPHIPDSDYDTVRVLLYDGPSFSPDESFEVMMGDSNWSDYPESYGWEREGQAKMLFDLISYWGVPTRVITIATTTYSFSYFRGGAYSWHNSGRLWFIDSQSLILLNVTESGSPLNTFVKEQEPRTLVSMISLDEWHGRGFSYNYYFRQFAVEGQITSNKLWMGTDFIYPDYLKGIVLGEIVPSNGDEICYGNADSLHLASTQDSIRIWEVGGITGLDTVKAIYNSSALFSESQILVHVGAPSNHYRLYRGSNGSLSAILSPGNISISKVADLNHDGNDEILSVNQGHLTIYSLVEQTSLNEKPISPRMFFLGSNYPNPFNSSTSIEFGLSNEGYVQLAIYNLIGQKVATLIDGNLSAGIHDITWNADEQSSGIYFYTLRAESSIHTKKMILLK